MTLTGHTITVERIADVPELHGTPLHVEAQNTFAGPTTAIIERRDGQFVRHHGGDTSTWRQSPGSHIFDAARDLADRLSSRRGEHEDLRYVGPGQARDVAARNVREGWYLRTGGKRGPWLRVNEVRDMVSLAEMRRTGQLRAKKRRFILEGGQTVTIAHTAPVAARSQVGAR